MPIDFPSSPTTNQTYTYNNKLWVFNGTAWVGGTVVSLLPAGSMQMYAGAVTQTVSAGVVTTTSPSGWLLANGNAVSRTTYSALFSAIGTVYGSGDGSTTFNLPSMAGRLPVAVGTGSGLTARTLGGTVGAESHTVSSSNISQFSTGNAGSHSHTPASGGSIGNVAISTQNLSVSGGSQWGFTNGTITNTVADHTHTVGSASPTAINHMPPSIGLNFIIKI